MDEAGKIALLTGFGGVALGGAITFATELIFRRQEKRNVQRLNISLCMAEVGRVYNELSALYRALTVLLPKDPPRLLSSSIRPLASTYITSSKLDTIVIFYANHKSDAIYSDLDLLFRRFNSTINTFNHINAENIEATNRRVQAGTLQPTGHEDEAQVTINLNDAGSVIELTRLENLYRDFFRSLIGDIEECQKILNRLNNISEKIFGTYAPWQLPAPKAELPTLFKPIEYLRTTPIFSVNDLRD